MKSFVVLGAVVAALALMPAAASAATCADYDNQAQAQRAADTRDADGDGVYCESLPCPCLGAGTSAPPPPAAPPPPPPPPPPPTAAAQGCSKPSTVQRLLFSSSRYPNIRAHMLAAIAKGWPRILVVNRPDADERRDRVIDDPVFGLPTRDGFDRDEYPPAVGRGRPNGNQKGLVRGINPIGWKADVMYVRSSENRSHGSSLGAKLRRFCNGTRFRYVFD